MNYCVYDSIDMFTKIKAYALKGLRKNPRCSVKFFKTAIPIRNSSRPSCCR